jgi:hypothetical protein
MENACVGAIPDEEEGGEEGIGTAAAVLLEACPGIIAVGKELDR